MIDDGVIHIISFFSYRKNLKPKNLKRLTYSLFPFQSLINSKDKVYNVLEVWFPLDVNYRWSARKGRFATDGATWRRRIVTRYVLFTIIVFDDWILIHFFKECKSHNSKLIEYFCKADVISQLLDIIATAHDDELTDENKRFK